MRDDFCDCDDCTGKTEIANLRAALHALATGLRWEEELRAWVLTDLGALTKARAALAPRSELREGEPCAKCGGRMAEASHLKCQSCGRVAPVPSCAPPAAPKEEA